MASKQQAPDRQTPAAKQEKAPAIRGPAPKAAGPDLSKPMSPRGARSAQGSAGNDAVSQLVGKAVKVAGAALNGDGPRPNGNNGNGGGGNNGGDGPSRSNDVGIGGFSMRTAGVGGRAAPAGKSNGAGPAPAMGGNGAPNGANGAGANGAPNGANGTPNGANGANGAAANGAAGGGGGAVDVGNQQMRQADPLAGFDASKGGKGLSGPVRGKMEAAFGVDFGDVRIHVGADSEKATAAVKADAMTIGADIHFGKGKFAPGSTPGDELLGHELTHVVQQGGGAPGKKKRQNKSSLGVSSVGDSSEAQANSAGSAAAQGRSVGAVSGGGPSVSRKGGAGGGGVKVAISGFVRKKPSQRAKGYGALGGEVNAGLSADVTATNEAMPELHAKLGVESGKNAPGANAEKKPASGKNSAAKGPNEPAGVAPKAPAPTPTNLPSVAKPAPVVSVAKTATPEQGQAAAKQAFAGISTNASVNTSAGTRPKIPKTGDGDPSKAETQRRETKQEAETARTAAKQEVVQGRGPETVKPKIMDQLGEIKQIVVDLAATTSPVEEMDKFTAKNLPADVVASFDQQQEAIMDASMIETEKQVDVASAKKDTDSKAQIDKATTDAEGLNAKAQAEHDASVTKAQGDITAARDEAMASQEKAVADFDRETQGRQKSELDAINAHISDAESKVDKEFAKAETQAESEVGKAEKEAAAKKKEEEEKANNRSWWDRVKDAVSSVFEAITNAINKILDKVLDVVKGILDKVKTWATDLIDAACKWVTDRIKQFASYLKEAVTALIGSVFPELAAKLNKAIDAAANWAVEKVEAVAEGLKAAVTAVCDTLSAALEAVVGAFKSAISMALAIMEAALTGDWAKVGLKILEAVLALAGIPKEEFYAVIGKVESTIDTIVDDPGGFVGNMIDAVGLGFGQFSDNFMTHLQGGFISWLTNAAAEAAIPALGSFELGDIFGWVMQTLGVDKGYIRGKAVRLVGEDNVERVEGVMDVIGTAMEGGWDGLWEYMQGYVDGLYDMVIGQVQDFIMTRVVQAAVIKIASMFNPVGAIVQAIITAWNMYQFLKSQIQRIWGVVTGVIDSIADIANGNIANAANLVEGALARLVPVAIDLLARILGLSGIPQKVGEIIKKVREKIDKAIDKVIDKIASTVKKAGDWVTGKGKKKDDKADVQTDAKADAKKTDGKTEDPAKPGNVTATLEKPVDFTAGSEGHKVWFSAAGGKASLMVASTPLPWQERIARWRDQLKTLPDDKKKEIGSAIGKAIAVEREAVKSADAAIKSNDPADATKADSKKAEAATAAGAVFSILPEGLKNTENVLKALAPFKALPAGVDEARAQGLAAEAPEKIRRDLIPDFAAFTAAAVQLGGTGAEKLRQIDTEEGLDDPSLKATAKTKLMEAYHKSGGGDLFGLMSSTLGTGDFKQKGKKLSKADVEGAIGADKTLARGMGTHAFQRGGILNQSKLKADTAEALKRETSRTVAATDVSDADAFAFFKKQLGSGAPTAVSSYVADGSGLVNPKYAGWFCPEGAIKSDAVFSQVIDGMALFANWYTEGLVTFKLTKSGLDSLIAAGSLRKPTVFDGLLSPLWSQRDNRDNNFGVTGGNVREVLVQASWGDVDQTSWRALPMDTEYQAVVDAARKKSEQRLSTDNATIAGHEASQTGKFKEMNAGLNAARADGKTSADGVANLPAARTDEAGVAPKLNASVVSKYASGPPPSDWSTRKVRTIPSTSVVDDDPGHTYHILDDGTVVSTSTPQVVKSDVASKTLRAAGVSLADLKKKTKSPKETLKDSGEMSAEDIQKMEGALKKNPRSEEKLDAATGKKQTVAKADKVENGQVKTNAESTHPDKNGSVKRAPMSEDEKEALLKGHAVLAKDNKEGADMRKVIPQDQVGQMLAGKQPLGGAEKLGPAVRGSIGHQRNTDGMNAEQTISSLGLDYEHAPSDASKRPAAGKTNRGNFTDMDSRGRVAMSQTAENKGIHYVDFKMTKEMEQGSGVAMSEDLIAKGKGSRDADVRTMATAAHPQEKRSRDDPFAATGATTSNAQVQKHGADAGKEFRPVLNQELNLNAKRRADTGADGKAAFELPEGSQMKRRGNRAGEDKTIATLAQKYDSAGKPILDWELNRELERNERGGYKNMMDKAKSDGKATARLKGEDDAAYKARMAPRDAKIAASKQAEEQLAGDSANPHPAGSAEWKSWNRQQKKLAKQAKATPAPADGGAAPVAGAAAPEAKALAPKPEKKPELAPDTKKADAEKSDKKDGVAPELKKEVAKDPVDPKADEHKKISAEIDDKAKKLGDVKQGTADIDALYAEAEHAYNELKGATGEIAAATGGAAKFPPGLKGKARAMEKVNSEYKGDASKLFDIARSSIEFTSLDALYKALDMVQGRFTVVRIKDRFQSPTKSGYRDMLLNLKASNGHVVEMQLHVEQILAVKNGEGHKLYEETRSIEAKAELENRALTEPEKNQVDAANGKAKSLYDAAFTDAVKEKKAPEPTGSEAKKAKEQVDKSVGKVNAPTGPPAAGEAETKAPKTVKSAKAAAPVAPAPEAEKKPVAAKKPEVAADTKKADAEKSDKKDSLAPELKKDATKDPVDPKADEHKKISAEIDDKAKKLGDVKQSTADIEKLYAEAEQAYNELKGATGEIAAATGGAAKFPPGLKGRERALEKVQTEYKGDASKLFDIARSSIEFTSLDALYKALDMVQGRFTVVRIKDRFQSPTKSGYRDMLLNLKASNGHVVEMQLHVEQILAVKNGEGHKLYEETRSIEANATRENRPLSEQEKNQVDAANGKAKSLYDSAFTDSVTEKGPKTPVQGEAKEAKKKADKSVAKEPKPVKPPKDYPEPEVIDKVIDKSIGAGTQAGPNPTKKVATNPGLRKEHEGTGVDYAEMKGEAFVKGDGDKDEVDPNDVKQGSLGDCYLIGGMAAVSRANPQYIKNLIKDNGDGTYDVTLYIKGNAWDSKGKPTVVTVDAKFPSGDKGFSAKYSKGGDKGPKGPELWVMLIEKAWAVHKGTYTGIEGGHVNDDGKFAGAIALLTNLNEGYYTPSSIEDKKLAAMIDEALKKGWPVACDSKNLDKESAALKAEADKAGVVGNHAYAPQRVDLQGMTLDLQNPWGSSHVSGLKIADFKKFYRGLRIGK
jgi:hypothetical protein